MTMTLDEVPAKLNELDLRAPLEVFEAINDAIRERDDLWSKWQTERCFREKAEAELAEAQNTIAAQQGTMGALKRKLALAEGELAALKARIDALMLEFCPDDMTDEQRAAWAARQKPVED